MCRRSVNLAMPVVNLRPFSNSLMFKPDRSRLLKKRQVPGHGAD
jgi:hypothetical protein